MKEDVKNLDDIEWEITKFTRSKQVFDSSFCPHLRVRLVEIKPSAEFELHEHEETQILYFSEGSEGIIELDFKQFPIKKDLVVKVRPGLCHGVKNTGNSPIRIIVFEEKMKSASTQTPYIDF